MTHSFPTLRSSVLRHLSGQQEVHVVLGPVVGCDAAGQHEARAKLNETGLNVWSQTPVGVPEHHDVGKCLLLLATFGTRHGSWRVEDLFPRVRLLEDRKSTRLNSSP